MDFAAKVACAREARMPAKLADGVDERKIEALQPYATALRTAVDEMLREESFRSIFGTYAEVAFLCREQSGTASPELVATAGDEMHDTCSFIFSARATVEGDHVRVNAIFHLYRGLNVSALVETFRDVGPGEIVSRLTDLVAGQVAEFELVTASSSL